VYLFAQVLSPSTAWLQWTDPSLGRPQQITDNRYYNVHYQVCTIEREKREWWKSGEGGRGRMQRMARRVYEGDHLTG